MLGWWVIRPSDPATQRIILKIVGFYMDVQWSAWQIEEETILKFTLKLLRYVTFEMFKIESLVAAIRRKVWAIIHKCFWPWPPTASNGLQRPPTASKASNGLQQRHSI